MKFVVLINSGSFTHFKEVHIPLIHKKYKVIHINFVSCGIFVFSIAQPTKFSF